MIPIPWYWYLAAIPVFGLLVLVHEFGHFITAKWAGIRVDEFAIGFPPRLFSFKRGETTYSINAAANRRLRPHAGRERRDERTSKDSMTRAPSPPSQQASG